MGKYKSFGEFEEASQERKQFNIDRKHGRGRASQSRAQAGHLRFPKSIWVGMVRAERPAKLGLLSLRCDLCQHEAHGWNELWIEYAVKNRQGSDQALTNHACLCERCRIEFQLVRHTFKLVMHYKNWIQSEQARLKAAIELTQAGTSSERTIELVDDDEIERLLRGEDDSND